MVFKKKKTNLADLKKNAKREKQTIILSTIKQGKKPQNPRYAKSNDKKRKALPPGKRISKNGKIYYAYRPDHTDRRFRKT